MVKNYKKLKLTEISNSTSNYFIQDDHPLFWNFLPTSSGFIQKYDTGTAYYINHKSTIPTTTNTATLIDTYTVGYNTYDAPIKLIGTTLYIPYIDSTGTLKLGYMYSTDGGINWTKVVATSGDEGYDNNLETVFDIFILNSEIYIAAFHLNGSTATWRWYNASQSFNYSTYGYSWADIGTTSVRVPIGRGTIVDGKYYFIHNKVGTTDYDIALWVWDGTNAPEEYKFIKNTSEQLIARNTFVTKQNLVWILQVNDRCYYIDRDNNVILLENSEGPTSPIYDEEQQISYLNIWISFSPTLTHTYKVYKNGFISLYYKTNEYENTGFEFNNHLYQFVPSGVREFIDVTKIYELGFEDDLDFISGSIDNTYLKWDTLLLKTDPNNSLKEKEGVFINNSTYSEADDGIIFHGTVKKKHEGKNYDIYECISNKKYDLEYEVPVSYTSKKASEIAIDLLDNHSAFLYKGTIQDGPGTPPTYTFNANTAIEEIFKEIYESEGRMFEFDPDGKTNLYSTIRTENTTAFALGKHGRMRGPIINEETTNAIQIIGGVKPTGGIAKLTLRLSATDNNNTSNIFKKNYPRMIDDTFAEGHEMYDLAARIIEQNEAKVYKWEYDLFHKTYLPSVGKYHKITDRIEGLTDELLILTSFTYDMKSEKWLNCETYDSIYISSKFEEERGESNTQRIEQVSEETSELYRLNAIGSENAQWVPVSFIATNQPGKVYQSYFLTNVDGTNQALLFNIDEVKSKNDLNLYVKGLRFNLRAANVTNYVDIVYVWKHNLTTRTVLLIDSTNRTTAGLYTYTFTAAKLLDTENLTAEIVWICGATNNITMANPEVLIYYA